MYNPAAHTETSPCMEDNIRRVRMHLNYGMARSEIHADLVPTHMTEEVFFLAYMAATVLLADEAIGYVPE